MWWMGSYGACGGGRKNVYRTLVGKPECILKNLGGKAWTWLFVIGQGEVTGCCEYGNEPSGYVKCTEFSCF